MGRFDGATWRGGTPNHGGAMVEQRGLVLHIADGTYEGTIAWCLNPDSEVSAHFIVARDGRITQMLDTTVTAWTQRAGNGHWCSVENEGHAPNPLTAAQIDANARIMAWGHRVHGWPLQLATAPSGRGLGHHSMGAEHGVDWGHSLCPGAGAKAQKPAILARAIAITEGDDMTAAESQTLKNIDWRVNHLPSPVDGRPVDLLTWTTETNGLLAGLSPEAIRERVEQLVHDEVEQLVESAEVHLELPPEAP